MKNRLASLQRRHDSSRGPVVVSAIVHGVLVAAAMIFAGTVVKNKIDEADVIKTFQLPPPPPPPPKGGRKKPKTEKLIERPKIEMVVPTIVPVEVPKVDESAPDIEAEEDTEGEDGGVEGGVEGGVIGGVIGGTVGGVLGNPLPEVVATEPRRMSSEITPPIRTTYVEPDYPAIAKRAKIQGSVILECIIDENGGVKVHKVIKPVAMVQAAAEEAVTKWKYTPAMLNGRPQAVFLVVTVKFNLSS